MTTMEAILTMNTIAPLSSRENGEGMIDYKTEHILSFTGRLSRNAEVIGPVPEGVRVNFYNAGGKFTGPRLRGKLREGAGGDWFMVRKDGMGLLDVRATFETDDGALIFITYQGFADLGEDGYDKFLQEGPPRVVHSRISPRFLTSHPKYLWLNRLHCFGVGIYEAATSSATYDIYTIR